MEDTNHTTQKIQLTDLPVELLFLIFRQAYSHLDSKVWIPGCGFTRVYSILHLVCLALE